MVNRRPLVVGIALAAALMTVGCASGGKVRVSGGKMCQAHGGTYNAATKSCSYTASTKSLRDSCQQQGGNWDDAAGFCEMGLD